jgi:hypothetical protein
MEEDSIWSCSPSVSADPVSGTVREAEVELSIVCSSEQFQSVTGGPAFCLRYLSGPQGYPASWTPTAATRRIRLLSETRIPNGREIPSEIDVRELPGWVFYLLLRDQHRRWSMSAVVDFARPCPE